MKKLTFLLSIFAVMFLYGNSFAAEINFQKGSFQEMLQKARSENKLLMVDFVTDWCKWCVELDRKVYSNADVADFANSHQVNFKIDAEKGEGVDLAKKYSVKGYPTIVFIDGDGNEVDRIYGYVEAADFLKTIKDYNAGVNTAAALKKMLTEDPNSPEANYQMANKLINTGTGEETEINAYLNKVLSVDPKNTKGFTDDAKIMIASRKQDVEGIKAFIKEYPTSNQIKDAYILLASTYADKNDVKNADKAYDEAMKKYGKDDAAFRLSYSEYLMGRVYSITQNKSASKKELKEGLKLIDKLMPFVKGSVNEASGYYLQSNIYLTMKDYTKAMTSINNAIKIYDKKSYQDQKKKIESASKETSK
jgi:thioredoxin-related protein